MSALVEIQKTQKKANEYHPAFYDQVDGAVYVCKHKDGSLSAIHDMNCLPPHVVVERDAFNVVLSIRNTLVAGYVKAGVFYTRDEVLSALEKEADDINERYQ